MTHAVDYAFLMLSAVDVTSRSDLEGAGHRAQVVCMCASASRSLACVAARVKESLPTVIFRALRRSSFALYDLSAQPSMMQKCRWQSPSGAACARGWRPRPDASGLSRAIPGRRRLVWLGASVACVGTYSYTHREASDVLYSQKRLAFRLTADGGVCRKPSE